MSKEVSVYLAGPTVFRTNPFEIANEKKAILQSFKMVGNFPFDNEVIPDASAPISHFGYKIGDANFNMMDFSTTVIADLTPFRSPSADSGTFGECTYMYDCGKMINGYSNDPRPYHVRVELDYYNGKTYVDAAGFERGIKDNMSIEKFYMFDNLMLPSAVYHSGGIFRCNNVPENEYYTNLDAFREVAREVSIKFGLTERPQHHTVLFNSPLNI